MNKFRDLINFGVIPQACSLSTELQSCEEAVWLFCTLHCCFIEHCTVRHFRVSACMGLWLLTLCAVDV